MIRGALAERVGDDRRAVKEWTAAAAGFDGASMGLFAHVTRDALGAVMGGAEGRRLREATARWMVAEGVRDPAALAGCILPRPAP
jgi:hypothetical protein